MSAQESLFFHYLNFLCTPRTAAKRVLVHPFAIHTKTVPVLSPFTDMIRKRYPRFLLHTPSLYSGDMLDDILTWILIYSQIPLPTYFARLC